MTLEGDGSAGEGDRLVETSEPSKAVFRARPPRFFLSLRWAIIGILVVVELVFGLVIEPWSDSVGGWWGTTFENYSWLVRFSILGSVVWLTFTQLERIEGLLERQRARIRRLYEASKQREEVLRTLYQASLESSREGDYRNIMKTIVAAAARLADASYGAVAEFDEHGRVVEFITVGVDPEVAAVIGLTPAHRGLLARLSGRDAVRIDDVTAAPDMAGFPPGHPSLKAFLGAPVRYEGELLGHLYLANPDEGGFTEGDARMLEMFAYQAAVAISRARMDRQRRELVRAEAHRRVASELHDGALQALYAVGIQLHRAQRRGITALTDSMTTANAIAAVDRAMAAIRGELYVLTESPHRTTTWDQLRKHVADVAALYGVALSWSCRSLPGLSRELASVLAAALAELVANAARHGGAGEVAVELACAGDELAVRVADDGSGVPAGTRLEEGNGLSGVRRRLAQVGGRLALDVGGRGVGAHIVVPVGAGGE